MISSILRGPDSRTGIDAQTRNVLFTVYAPGGIEEELVNRHLDDIEAYIKLNAGEADTYLKKVY